MKQPKTISQNGYTITVSEATALMGMRHSILQEQMAHEITKEDDDALRYLKRIWYPALVSAVTAQEGFSHWPLSFAEFCELPEQFCIEWERAVWEINPHWQPGYEPVSSEEKKEPTPGSSSGSADS